ncbi:amine oxidase [Coxiella burnetii]|uniref:Protoporphyrinogen oxidase n=1 Tax=Coxiella burnetii (strain Dugway 5J108-111) TaxID=434922 RepID=A9KF07_COXBN|nr:FAD-dependent oxidoreductase [Coxiella burnetii]ABS77751.1 protoporphyrinogen oxidase [Coxiella burnetii Dugway 5J108-111]OYK83217.1 amine oxidase [Coxiella burnetii]
MKRTNPHIAILGGGPAGLYAARLLTRQNFRVTVLDKGERPGGLATAQRYGENWYDTGQHMFHSFDREIFEDVKTLMGEERIEVELNARIKWAGGYFRYPLQFQDMIKGIPFFKLCRQVSGLFSAQFKNAIVRKTPKDAEEALIQLYGKPLYKFFFEDFTHRYWEIHPKGLSATFITSKMPKLTAVDVLKKGLEKIGIKDRGKTTESPLTKEILHYSRTGSETMPRCVAKAVIDAGGEVLLRAEVKNVITENNNVKKIIYQRDGETRELECDACISTIPINALIRRLDPVCPDYVLNAVNHIRYKPIAIYGLLVNKPKCFDGLFVYYRNHIFHRICEPKNAGLEVNPPDHTVLIVETTCEIDDPKWRGEASVKEQIFSQLAQEGLCQPDEIVETHLTRCETGYPIFALGFEKHLDIMMEHLQNITNLVSTGRQGAFTYPDMHGAMRMGISAAENIMQRFG